MIPTALKHATRYVSHLLRKGKNDSFQICAVAREVHQIEGTVLGYYYKCLVRYHPEVEGKVHPGYGQTPEAAVRDALTKHGVTFR